MSTNKLIGLPFLIVILTIQMLNNSTSNDFKEFVILFAFVIYIFAIYTFDRRFLFKYGYIIFYISTNIIGVFIIETNQLYLNELARYSNKADSLALITLAHIFFIETIRILNFEEIGKKPEFYLENGMSYITFRHRRISKEKVLEIILIMVSFLFLALLLRVIDKPFFIVKMDRFIYEEKYLPGIFNSISNLFIYVTVLISMYIYKTKQKLALIPLLIGLVYLFWIGHKFSFFINIAFILFLPYIWMGSSKVLKKVLKGSLIFGLLLLLVISAQSSIIYDRSNEENIVYMKNRVAQQGQLWWAMYDLSDKTHFSELNDETKIFFELDTSPEDLYDTGIYKVMKLTTPYNIFINKVVEKNSRYAYSTQSSIYYYFGAIGLIVFSIISGLIYYFITKGLIKSIVNQSIISSLLYVRIWIIFNRVIIQSDFNKLFSLEVIIILFLLLLLRNSNKVLNKKISSNTKELL